MLEKYSKKACALAVLSVFSASLSMAAEKVDTSENEDEIIFTANRTATLASEVGSQSIVITEKEIQTRQYHTATEALAHQPGLILSQNSINGPSSFYVRGSDRTLTLVDGVPMYDPMGTGGSFNFMSLGALLDVSRIEVLKGPQSSLYGSSAMGGVIQVFTNRLNNSGTKLRFMAGSHETGQINVTTSGAINDFRYSLAGLFESSKGIDATMDHPKKSEQDYDKDSYKNRQLSGAFNYLLNENFDIDFTFNYNNQFFKFDDPLSSENIDANTRSKLFSGRVAINGLFMDDKLTSTLSYALMNLKRKNDAGLWNSDHFTGRTQTLSLDNTLSINPDFISLFGIRYMHERAKAMPANFDRTQHTKSIYVEQNLNFFDSFFNTIGLRYDKNSAFGGKVTYRLTSRYNFSDMLAVKGGFGTGFTTPTVAQLFYKNWGANPDLKAERSRGFDIGLEFSPTDNILISLSYFRTKYKDMISWYTFPGTWDGENRNLDRAKIEGFEIVGSLSVSDKLALSGSYTYLDAKQKGQDGIYKNMDRRPRHQVTANVTYRPIQNMTLNASGTYYGKRKDKQGAETLKSFAVFDIAGSYKINNTFEVDAKIQNVFNKDYEYAAGYRERGRSAYVGVNISL